MAAKVIKKSILLDVSVSKKKYTFETYIFFRVWFFELKAKVFF